MDLQNLIWQLVKDKIITKVDSYEVIEVDKGNDTCRLRPYDGGPELLNVRLAATVESKETKIVAYPKPGSTVLAVNVNNLSTEGVVVAAGEVEQVVIKCDQVIFNAGANKGLVKVSELVDKINRLEDRIKNHQHTYVSSSGPAVTTADPVSNPAFVNTAVSDLENNKIKH